MFSLDRKGNKPIYEQIVEQMKWNVMKGYLQCGDAIPSVRKMALELNITPGTVAKAYQELERQKVIETIRGKGAFISNMEIKRDDEKLKDIKKNLISEIMEMKIMGLSKKEVTEIVTNVYEEI